MAACQIGRACLALMNPPPVSASWVELMTASMTLHGTWTGWLCIGGLLCFTCDMNCFCFNGITNVEFTIGHGLDVAKNVKNNDHFSRQKKNIFWIDDDCMKYWPLVKKR